MNDKHEFMELTGVTVSDGFFNIAFDDFSFNGDPEYDFEEFCKDWMDNEEGYLITCHRQDFLRLEKENKKMAAELSRLKNVVYNLHIQEGVINFTITNT